MKTSWKIVLSMGLVIALSSCLKTRSDVEEAEQEKVINKNVSELQRTTADQEVRFQDIDSEFRNLSGRIEVLEGKLNIKNATEATDKQSYEQRLSKLEELSTLLQEAMAKHEADMASLQQQINSLRPKKSKTKKKKLGNYSGAEQAFKQKRWKDAIFGYEKYLQLNPKGRVAHMASYKMGVCFQELKEVEDAKVFYQLTIDKYPNSEGAKKAKYRLKNLK